MKSLQRSQSNTFAGVVSLVLIYVLLITLILIFSNQILNDIASGETLSNIVIIPMAVALPVFLIGTIIFNVARLLKERRRGNPGARFKSKLVVFFAFIALLSSIPQGILSISFINTVTRSWFSSQYTTSLRGGVNLALSYYNEKLVDLQFLIDSLPIKNLIRNFEDHPEKTWNDLKSINNEIKSLQIFDDQGEEVLFRGEEHGRLVTKLPSGFSAGLLPKETTRTQTILRGLIELSNNGKKFSAVLSTVLPPNFDKEAESLTNTLERFTQMERYQRIFRLVLIGFYFFFSFPILLLSILISFLLSDEVIRPIVNLEEATKRVSEGDFSIRILSRTGDELSILIGSFNRMVSELDKSRRQLIQTEKMTTWQEIAQRMAHEIKNPLTPIKLSAQRILRKYQAGEEEGLKNILEPAISSIILEVEKLNNLLMEFRDFARLPAPKAEKTNLKNLVDTAASVFLSSNLNVTIHTEDIDTVLSLRIDRDQLTRVFTNLFKNAIESIEGKGDIYVRADLVIKGNLDYCRIQVHDTGKGIAVEDQEKVFNPYFTTKERGTGLGLSIVERIIFDHKGMIWFETQEHTGTTFFIDLPMEAEISP